MASNARQLIRRYVPKPWGQSDFALAITGCPPLDEPLGEIWFEDVARNDLPLLVKLLFTSQKLSVQVHPDDAFAAAKGLPRGKDEAWLVLAAEPGALIGIGLRHSINRE